jgi:hypothetical protein
MCNLTVCNEPIILLAKLRLTKLHTCMKKESLLTQSQGEAGGGKSWRTDASRSLMACQPSY